MKVQLEKSFPLPVPAEAAWALLQDLEAVASCMPGASITERVDERRYKGTVTVRMGPASLQFRGEVEVKELDAATRSLRMTGRGTDTTGTSGAAMDLRARIDQADAASCVLAGSSEFSVSGKAAAFGSRMMQGAADQVLQQFVANFARRLQESRPEGSAVTGGVEPAAAAPAARELNGLALAWAMLRDWVAHLFPARRA